MLLKKVQINYAKMGGAVDTLLATVRAKYPLDGEKEYRVRLVVCELLNNILSYSDAENIVLSAALQNGVLTITMEDNGSGFEPAGLLERDVTSGEHLLKENGRGVFLVRQIADDIAYNEKGNAVKVTIDLNRS